MKLTNCQMCALSKGREHTSFSKGQKPASVMIVFGREPRSDKIKDRLQEFVRTLNYDLKHDWYYSYAIKCSQKDKVDISHIKACRKWLLKEIEDVNPYLIILMGKLPLVMALGGRYRNLFRENVFYFLEGSKGKGTRHYFFTEDIKGDTDVMKQGIEKLLAFIREYYG